MNAFTPRADAKILVDGGDPEETRRIRSLIGYVDGQTTNPTLVSKNPEVRTLVSSGHTFSSREELDEYKKIVQTISPLVGGAGVSIVREGMRVNMTLCFSQEQAAAVYAATKGSKAPVYISPFVGRLDDRGENGMDLVRNIKKMYETGDGHVHVLAASIRHLQHLLGVFAAKADLVTAPGKVWQEWAASSFPLPGSDFVYQGTDKAGKPLKPMAYKAFDLNRGWESFDIRHDLTTRGIQQFVADYNSTLKQSA